MITYSANGSTDFRYAEIAVQVIPTPVPSQSELAATLETNSNYQLVWIGATPVIVNAHDSNGDPAW